MPKLSVCIVTYNHENYIEQCLQSMVEQEVDFEFEVIVGDDCSTDGTRTIIRKFAEKYPELVRPVFHERNLGPSSNYALIHGSALGTYVAHLDGDDYALPGKLAKQVAFLDAHPDCVMVGHQTRLQDAVTGEYYGYYLAASPPPVADLTYLLEKSCYFTHSSKMYRRSANTYMALPQNNTDFWLHVWHAAYGKIGYIDEILGVYRARNPNSMTGSASPWRLATLENHIQAYDLAVTLGVPESKVAQIKAVFALDQAIIMLRSGDSALFRQWVDISWSFFSSVSVKQRLAFHLRDMPWLFRGIFELNLKIKMILKMI